MSTGPSRKGRQSQLRKGRFSEPDRAYFVTKCVLHRDARPLANPECAEVLVKTFVFARDQGWLRVLGFVVMPDHYHLILAPRRTLGLAELVRRMNDYVAHEVNRILRREGPFWQKGFYDHAIRDRRDFDAVLEYVHANPVRAGLVESPEDWPYSTAHPVYAGLIDWAWLGPSIAPHVKTRHRFDPDRIPWAFR